MADYDDAVPEGRKRDRADRRDGERHDDEGRERDRTRDVGDRRERDRGRPSSRDRDRDRDRGRSSRHKSRSRSRTPPRRERRRKTGFDKMPAEGAVSAAMPNLPGMPAVPGLPGLPGAPVPGGPTQQATRHARRVYVGGLPPTATEQSIAMFMSQALAAIGGTTGPGDCVINVYINAEKKFAFVEFRTVEETSNAMALDGIMFEGVTVRVRRPNDYNPTAAASLGPSVPSPGLNLEAIGLQAGGGGGNAADGPDRIFVGGLPYYWMEDQCKELLQSFGPIKAFDLVRDRETGNSKGYGFVVYQDPAVTDPACAGLNGMKIGDKTLTVRRATQAGQAKPENIELLMQAQQQMAQLQAAMGGGGAGPKMPMVLDPLATPVVALANCFDLEELNDPEAYTEIFEDMQEECGKYGNVEKLIIPKPTDENTSGLGKVIIKYTSAFEAGKAKAAMHGRRFGGKTVEAVYISDTNYSAGVLG